MSAADALAGKLFPLMKLITPNLPEAEFLLGRRVSSDAQREQAAAELAERYGCSVLIKGGHSAGNADDLLYNQENGSRTWYRTERISNDNTHGTGCTLSSAAACGLAQGKTLEESVREAKEYITGAIRDGMNLGKGNGPLNHFWKMGGSRAYGTEHKI